MGPGPARQARELAVVTPTATPPVDRSQTVPRGGFDRAGSALILVAGAAVYSGAEATCSLPFDVTPLVVGAMCSLCRLSGGVVVDDSFVGGRAEIAQRRVPADVVPALDVLERGLVQPGDGRPRAGVDESFPKLENQLSATALSQHSPLRPNDIVTPSWRARLA